MPRTKVRPGHVIRDVLTEQIPVAYGQGLQSEATPGDLYRTYIALVKEANGDAVSRTRQRGMSRHSFTGLLYQAKRLNLIVASREEPALGLPSEVRAPLLNIDGVRTSAAVPVSDRAVVEARRLYYRIGGGDARYSTQWNNIPRAYMDLVERLR